jgi:uncharacterized protein
MAGTSRQEPRQPGMFDAFRLATGRQVLQGTLDVAASERLYDRLTDGPGTVEWRIAGTTDEVGRPALAISIDGTVPLECQRCLGTFDLPVAQQTIAVLARNEADADSLDAGSEHEVLVADHAFNAVELVEDELLLTLPYAPMHPDGECEKAAEDS